jgi:hypothetical protein
MQEWTMVKVIMENKQRRIFIKPRQQIWLQRMQRRGIKQFIAQERLALLQK